MKQKIIATGAGIALVTLAAVGAFASQDAVDTQEEPLVESSGTPTETPTDTPTDEATETPTETPTEEATATPTELAEEDEDGEDDDVHGIPDSNPSKHPEDGDGICEKGETVVKTTPSGTQVNVPCNAVKDDGDGERHGKPSDDVEADVDDEDEADDEEEEGEEEED